MTTCGMQHHLYKREHGAQHVEKPVHWEMGRSRQSVHTKNQLSTSRYSVPKDEVPKTSEGPRVQVAIQQLYKKVVRT